VSEEIIRQQINWFKGKLEKKLIQEYFSQSFFRYKKGIIAKFKASRLVKSVHTSQSLALSNCILHLLLPSIWSIAIG
jgi:hypothetical protein